MNHKPLTDNNSELFATMKKPHLSFLGAAICAAIHSVGAHAAGVDVYAPSIGGLDDGYYSDMGGSGDGNMLVGTQIDWSTGQMKAFQWTLLGGKHYLPSLGPTNKATAASFDGSVVVGTAFNPASGLNQGIRWTGDNIQFLDALNHGLNAQANAVSADGSIVAGVAVDGLTGHDTAVMWDASGAVTSLGYLNDGTSSFALGLSADGHVAVGYAEEALNGNDVATRWVNGASAESLGKLIGGTTSQATAANQDGSYIVGFGDSTLASQEAFIWTEQSGIKGLGLLTDGTLSKAQGISANGAVVVGIADTTGAVRSGFRWTAQTGMQSLLAWLQDNDPSYTLFAGNTLDAALGVSADGNTVYGLGKLNGRDQPFVARTYGPIAQPVITTPPVIPPVTPPVVTPPVDPVTPPVVTPPVTTPVDPVTPPVTPPVVTPPVTTPVDPVTPPVTKPVDPVTPSKPDTGAVGGDSGTGTAPNVGVIGLLDMGDSLHNATLYSQAMQSQMQTFTQDQMRCETFDLNGVCVNVSAQFTRNNGTVQGDNVYGGLSVAYRITPDLVAGVGYQGPSSELKINDDHVKGDTNTVGAFIEYGNRLRSGPFLRGAAAYSDGDATIDRSYLTGAGQSKSKGKADVKQKAVSAQAGYVFIVDGNSALMPYLGVDYLNTKLGSYTETSGPFPARFDSRTENNIYGTAGLNGSINLANKAIVTANLKHVERLNNSTDNLSGEVLGVSRFNLKQDTTDRWNEAGIGLQLAGPVKASRVGLTYSHRFASDKAVASDVATVSFSVGF
ncbi:autotransporter domain-containing protein [Pseudomonas lactis]|uniref:autotransporter domain-containing protein n=1 Tax=Pseudomonas lactis TaxID=1615674 RepID=UPI003F7DC221